MNTDYENVVSVIDQYIEGSYTADAAMLKEVFHPNAIMAGYLGNQKLIATPNAFIEDVTSVPSMQSRNDDYRAVVQLVEVTENVASVILRERGFRGNTSFVDHFHLIRENDQWKIISKTFTTI